MGTVRLQTNGISLKPNKHPGQDVFINITSIYSQRKREREREEKWLWSTEEERSWIIVPHT